jgi:hypothetical protein
MKESKLHSKDTIQILVLLRLYSAYIAGVIDVAGETLCSVFRGQALK